MSTITHSYLTEDLAQILRYFPGASPVTLDTPFDLHDRKAKLPAKRYRARRKTSDLRLSHRPASSTNRRPARPVVTPAKAGVQAIDQPKAGTDAFTIYLLSLTAKGTRWTTR